MPDNERRYVVEVITPAEVSRLEGIIQKQNEEIDALKSRLDGFHRTLYDVISTLRRTR